MKETLKEMQERHHRECTELRKCCPHTEVKVCDDATGFRQRRITIICESCGEPIMGWHKDGDTAAIAYAKGFVKA